MELPERFWDKVQAEPNSGCWFWMASLDISGYGQFAHGDTIKKAHRVSYEAYVGLIPIGLEIDHLCRMRCCVNPDHLEAVTHKENLRRGNSDYNRHKTHCPHGHPYSGENLYITPQGTRSCVACKKSSARRSYEKRKQATAPNG